MGRRFVWDFIPLSALELILLPSPRISYRFSISRIQRSSRDSKNSIPGFSEKPIGTHSADALPVYAHNEENIRKPTEHLKTMKRSSSSSDRKFHFHITRQVWEPRVLCHGTDSDDFSPVCLPWEDRSCACLLPAEPQETRAYQTGLSCNSTIALYIIEAVEGLKGFVDSVARALRGPPSDRWLPEPLVRSTACHGRMLAESEGRDQATHID